MKRKHRYYVAYGSNLNMEQMRMRCPTAVPVGTTNLVGYKLLFKGSKTGAYLTIEEDMNRLVPVAIWRVTERDEAALDRYEGFPKFYYKKDVVLGVNGIAVNAFVYIMREDRKVGIPNKFYVDVCRDGYLDFGLDEYYLDKALIESRRLAEGEEKVS